MLEAYVRYCGFMKTYYGCIQVVVNLNMNQSKSEGMERFVQKNIKLSTDKEQKIQKETRLEIAK